MEQPGRLYEDHETDEVVDIEVLVVRTLRSIISTAQNREFVQKRWGKIFSLRGGKETDWYDYSILVSRQISDSSALPEMSIKCSYDGTWSMRYSFTVYDMPGKKSAEYAFYQWKVVKVTIAKKWTKIWHINQSTQSHLRTRLENMCKARGIENQW